MRICNFCSKENSDDREHCWNCATVKGASQLETPLTEKFEENRGMVKAGMSSVDVNQIMSDSEGEYGQNVQKQNQQNRKEGLRELGYGVLWALMSIGCFVLVRLNLLDEFLGDGLFFILNDIYQTLTTLSNLDILWAKLILMVLGLLALVILLGWIPYTIAAVFQVSFGVRVFKSPKNTNLDGKDRNGA